jgi:cysteine desulfurase/selenocysteine lyase
MQRRYFDNAATSWPKPPAVYDAVDRYQRESGVSLGRAATRRGAELQVVVDRCRRNLAEMLNADSPRSIVFAFNGTDALNLAIHGWVAPGDHVVTSVAEHNSVLRPLRTLQDRMAVAVDYAAVDREGIIDPESIRRLIRPRTRLIAITHASNVTGATQPIAEIGAIAREAEVALLVDAAQTAGHLPIDVRAMNIDFLACSGHKGLLGPLGTGVLCIRDGRERELRPLRQGGTGSLSESEHAPDQLPDRYEVGNHNSPGLVGLDASVAWLRERGLDQIRAHEIELTSRLVRGLSQVPGVTMFGPADASRRVGTVSFRLDGMDAQTCSALLDNEFGIESRAGLHCAPRMHKSLGTLAEGGLVRLSVGPFQSTEDVDAAIAAVAQLAGASPFAT